LRRLARAPPQCVLVAFYQKRAATSRGSRNFAEISQSGGRGGGRGWRAGNRQCGLNGFERSIPTRCASEGSGSRHPAKPSSSPRERPMLRHCPQTSALACASGWYGATLPVADLPQLFGSLDCPAPAGRDRTQSRNCLCRESTVLATTDELRQCHVPDFRSFRLALRSLDAQRHDEFAAVIVLVDGMAVG